MNIRTWYLNLDVYKYLDEKISFYRILSEYIENMSEIYLT